jgi:hypothetical protein
MKQDIADFTCMAVQCVLNRDGSWRSVMPPKDCSDEQWEAFCDGKRPLGSRYYPGHECQFSILSVPGGSE